MLSLLAGAALVAAPGGAPPGPGTPSRAVIEQHRDTTVRVFDRYAAVRLPIRHGVPLRNPAYLTPGPEGVIYGANLTGEIFSIHDTDGDGLEDTARLFHDLRDEGIRTPTGMVFRDGELYVGTPQGVRVYADRDRDGRADTSRPLFQGAPVSEHPYEWTSALTFGPDGHLYLVLATDSWNAGPSPDPDGLRGSMLRIAPDGGVERFATGLRSVHGMAFNGRGDLFFVDNEGGGNPGEELNLARRGAFYGHNPDKFGAPPPATAPLLALRTEVAPAGMEFHPGPPGATSAGELFIAFYGPGERWTRGAIARVTLQPTPSGGYDAVETPVATGIAKISDLAFGPSGDLYASQVGRTDYWYQPLERPDGGLYRLVPAPWVVPDPLPSSMGPAPTADQSVLARGRQLFAERACSACHAVDGTTELLGPDLGEVGRVYSREELLEEIRHPSRRIKPSMEGTRIEKRDGTVLLGRVVGADGARVRLLVVGNRLVDVPRADIRSQETASRSLMPEGLLQSLPTDDVDALLAYLATLRGDGGGSGLPGRVEQGGEQHPRHQRVGGSFGVESAAGEGDGQRAGGD